MRGLSGGRASFVPKPAAGNPMTEIIGVAALLKLCESARLIGEQVASKTGELREQIADAVENKHLHKQAFSTASKYYKMRKKDELKAKEFGEQLRIYLDAIDDNWPDEEHIGDFDKDAGKAAENGAGKQAASNVRALRGIRKLKTDAGVADAPTSAVAAE
jgi:hypothetical protein